MGIPCHGFDGGVDTDGTDRFHDRGAHWGSLSVVNDRGGGGWKVMDCGGVMDLLYCDSCPYNKNPELKNIQTDLDFFFVCVKLSLITPPPKKSLPIRETRIKKQRNGEGSFFFGNLF